MPLREVRDLISRILYNGESIGKARLDGGKAKLLVGHNLDRKLDCLLMSYPEQLLRSVLWFPIQRLTETRFLLVFHLVNVKLVHLSRKAILP